MTSSTFRPDLNMATHLNAAVHYKNILGKFDIPVNKIPGTVRCPVCGSHGALHVCEDGRNGYWYYCDNAACAFSGDSYQLYAAAKHLTLKNAVRRLLEGKIGQLTPMTVESYLRATEQRVEVHKFWARSQEELVRGLGCEPFGAQILRGYHLEEQVWQEDWSRKLRPYLGMAYRNDIHRYASVNTRIPGRNRVYMITTNMILPGLLNGFTCFDVFRGIRRSFCVRLQGMDRDGLMFLNMLHAYNDVVYAIGCPELTMAIHCWASRSLYEKLPVIGWTAGVDNAWKQVNAEKIILWEPDCALELYRTAKHIDLLGGNPYVSAKPTERADNPFDTIMPESATYLLREMRESSKPWLEALRNKLIGNRFWGDNVELLQGVALDVNQRLGLLQTARNEEEHRQLGELLDCGGVAVTLDIQFRRKLVQRHNCWYVLERSGEECLALDAIPIVHSRITFPNGSALYRGDIIHKDVKIPFSVSTDTLKKLGDIEWLRRHVAAHGNGAYPVIDLPNNMTNKIFMYACRFHEPKQLAGINTLGWDERSLSFIFPNFSVSCHGEFEDANCVLQEEHPADNLPLPGEIPVGLLYRYLTDTPTHACYWATLSCVIANILAPSIAKQMGGTAIMATSGGMAQLVLDKVIRECGLRRIQLEEKTDYAQLRTQEAAHNLPVCVGYFAPGRTALYKRLEQGSTSDLILLLTDKATAMGLALQKDWAFVQPVDATPAMEDLEGTEILMPHILAYFQKQERKLPHGFYSDLTEGQDKQHLAMQVLHFVSLWIRDVFEVKNRDVFTRARTYIAPHSITCDRDQDIVFLYFLLTLVYEHGAPFKEEGRVSRNSTATIAVSHDVGEVFINRQRLQAFLKRERLPMLYNPSHVTEAFMQKGVLIREELSLNAAGWVISKDHYLKVWEAYKRTTGRT